MRWPGEVVGGHRYAARNRSSATDFQENSVTDPFRKTTALDFLVRAMAATTLVSVVDCDGQGTVLPAVPDTVEGAHRGGRA